MHRRTCWSMALLTAVAVAGCGPPTAAPSSVTESPPVSAVASSTTATLSPTSVAPPVPVGATDWQPPEWEEPTVPPRVTVPTTTPMPVALDPGAEGPDVARLQEAMARAGFFRDEIDGVFGERTAAAVVAVHKALDLSRTASWTQGDWKALAAYGGPELPDRVDEPDRIEIDLTRQLLYRLADDVIVDVIPVSSGNGELYQNATGATVRARTPRGDFALYKHYEGWRISYLGGLYRPWYFTGGYAIHGSASVPPVPASHGCVRLPNWEADYLAGVLSIGLPVHVWD